MRQSVAGIETSVGGRIGLFALDTASGSHLAHRADERFALCSTFKWALAAAVLERIDRGEMALHEAIDYGRDDLLDYAPVARKHVQEGKLTVEALAEAAVTVSDNTAANLLLARVGGPSGFTSFVRRMGDEVTRLDRDEPALNTNLDGDPRDTTSPRAMVGLMRRLLLGKALSATSRKRLIGWMLACKTCGERLRRGFPATWRYAAKTGTGMRGAVNEVAIVWPDHGGPILVASYMSDAGASVEALSAGHADIARLVSTELG